MPRRLPDELLEEVLRRLPPHEPAELVRAALVSRRWCRLVTDASFRRRFREFHRSPPMLGLLCNQIACDGYKIDNVVRFIPTTTTAVPSPHTDFRRDIRVLDARHGRVLCERGESVLAVWDPITDEVHEFPFPKEGRGPWTAAVLCSAAGACDHLDCHHGPFLVAYVCFSYRHGTSVVHTYSSDAAAWSEPVCAPQTCVVMGNAHPSSALVGNALYFVNLGAKTALKYDLELCQASLIQLPYLSERWYLDSMLTTTEDGRLWFVTKDDSKLYMWSEKDTNHDLDAKWERRFVELKTVLPVDSVITKFSVIGSGVGNIFIKTGDEIYKIDLKTYKVKKVYEGTPNSVFPYMSFYTPALGGICTGEGPSTSCSSACRLKGHQ